MTDPAPQLPTRRDRRTIPRGLNGVRGQIVAPLTMGPVAEIAAQHRWYRKFGLPKMRWPRRKPSQNAFCAIAQLSAFGIYAETR